ncbi:hypothetical protein L3Y34_007206 [Caenorhabditis briggsae]|uniref:Seven TM Receptor n=1 Tax=Caenorhabditis briggsae TaxID=6238 RepID=A0AAE9A177_CAEBR|nr:hypothetical protein L3Y34_007206 [Caenorhabditis briggsae]
MGNFNGKRVVFIISSVYVPVIVMIILPFTVPWDFETVRDATYKDHPTYNLTIYEPIGGFASHDNFQFIFNTGLEAASSYVIPVITGILTKRILKMINKSSVVSSKTKQQFETLTCQHYSHGPTFLVIVGTQDKMFGPETLTILNACWWGFFGASMAIFDVHFVYRWLVVSEHHLLESFNDWRVVLWFSIPLWYGLTWVCTGYFLSAANESTSRFIKDNIKQKFGWDFNDYIYLGPYLYEVLEDGSYDFHWMAFLGQGIITATIISSVVIVLVFGYRCYDRISHLVATSSSSARFQKLQRQLFYALVIQTFIPFVLMHIPGAIMVAFVFMNIDLGVYSAVLSMTIAIYPAVDPLPTLFIVESYRKALLRFLRCQKKTKPNVSSVATISSRF